MPEPHFLRRPKLYPEGFRDDADLPYGLLVSEVSEAMETVYDFLHEVNGFLVERGYGRLEEMILGNSLSGFISEMVVKNLSAVSSTLIRNRKVGGHPDLILRGSHPDDSVLHAEEGIEVKTSIQSGGWQGHNPERSYVMIVQYAVDVLTEPVENRRPIEVLKVMCALLDEQDWSFSGRTGESRRTPTASILQSGTAKLHDNYVYQHPHYVRNLRRMAEQLRELHIAPSTFEEGPIEAAPEIADVEQEISTLIDPD